MGIFASKEAQARDAEEEEEKKRQEHARRQRQQQAYYEENERQQALKNEREARERQRQQRHAEVKADYRRRLLGWRGDDTTSVDGKAEGSCTRFNHLNVALALRFLDEHPHSAKWIVHESNRTHYQSSRNYASTYVIGKFVCKNGEAPSAQSRQRKQKKKQKWKNCSQWSSGKIFVEVFVKDVGNQFNFDVIVWNQACRKCGSVVSPTFTDDDKAVFMTRIFSKLELLIGLRRALRNDWDFDGKETAPHDQARCSLMCT
uniref:Uncharacterized protein n=1 Tax=Globisporangium ultimum (strain ATCC 200006 / CBS 805.95 / DAOM BR144) TaxID=431595 RepID=K3X496_GLOUD